MESSNGGQHEDWCGSHRSVRARSVSRVYDIVHACVGGTYGVLSALDWAQHPDRRHALVIATDVARYGLGTPGEPTQGAGAVAMVISKDPRLLELRELSTFSSNVYDFWKHPYEAFPMVKGVYSVQCYVNAAKACFKRAAIDRQAAFVYHTPYPTLVEKAHAEVAATIGVGETWRQHYADKVAASTRYITRIGNTYTASLWLAHMSSLEQPTSAAGVRESADPGQDTYLFSYGSGCGAALMHARPAHGASSVMAQFQLGAALDRRVRLSVDQYEQLHRGKTPEELSRTLSPDCYFTFDGRKEHERCYSARSTGTTMQHE